jgi:PAS domain S-box-containing protein
VGKVIDILIVEDSKNDAVLILRQLSKDGFQVNHEIVETKEAMSASLDHHKWDIVISDYSMPGFSGLGALGLLKEKAPDLPCIIVSGKITEETAVATMRAGARDYVMKDNLKRLGPAITRELADERVKENEAFNSSLLDNAPNPILVTAPDTSIIYVNSAFKQLTGYSNRELANMKVPYPWWPPEKLANSESSNNTEMHIENCYLKKNNRPFWVESSTTEIRNRNETKYYLNNWVDITERKKTELALRDSEHRYRSLFENMLDGFAYCRMIYENNQPVDFIYLSVNKSFERFTGLKDVVGKLVTQIIPGIRESNPEVFSIYGRVALTGHPEQFETYLKQLQLWLFISVYSTERETFIVVFENISERKKMEIEIKDLYEKEKQQREELEEETKARGLFINVLAHELRTPITPILASTGFLKDLLESRPESTEKKIIDNIYTSTEKLARRLEDLLEIARYTRGTFQLNLSQVNLKTYLNEAVEGFRPTIIQHGQEFLVDISSDLPVTDIDPSRLEQVIINLLSNASKFSPAGGKIYLKAGMIGDFLQIEVKDEGIGIPIESQGRLFQPYHRVVQDRQQFPGLGLGLAVAKQIVEAHGGKIWLTSESGKGSTFTINIPLKRFEIT